MGLGGKATNTSRGQSAKLFIKKGTNQAKIVLRICNYNGCRADAFQYEKYGRYIYIERVIREGQSVYALKNLNEEVVSTKKSDIDALVRYFSMQIDNPVCILNQEISRNFLNSKKPGDKYEFFMKATRLDRICEAYKIAQDMALGARERLQKKLDLIPEIKKDLDIYERKYKLLSSCTGLIEKLSAVNSELVWANAIKLEKNYEELTTHIATSATRMDNATQNEKVYQLELRELKEKEKAVAADAEVLIKQLEDISRIIRAVKEECKVIKTERRSKQDTINMSERKIRDVEKNIKDLIDAIKEAERKNQ